MRSVDITIRNATPSDLEQITTILLEDPAPDLRAIVPDPAKVRRVGALLARHGMLVGIHQTELAMLEGTPVGLMESLRSTNQQSLGLGSAAALVARAIWYAGAGVLRRYQRLDAARDRMGIRIPPGTFDLNELDVLPAYRNRGLGTQLIAHAERVARERGFREMWLTTEIDNPAVRLYQRHGFRVERQATDPVYEEMTGAPGRVLMMKDLTRRTA
jgi:ribosomal protein S18 acetylase RimI-like enzyme